MRNDNDLRRDILLTIILSGVWLPHFIDMMTPAKAQAGRGSAVYVVGGDLDSVGSIRNDVSVDDFPPIKIRVAQ